MIGRRGFMKGGAAMVAPGGPQLGAQPSPSRFPYPGRPQSPGGAPGAQGQIVRAKQVIISGANGSLLVYSGPPALGNLIYSISPVAFTDPKGNHVLAGAVSYNPPWFVQVNQNDIVFGNGTVATTMSVNSTGPAGMLQMASPNAIQVNQSMFLQPSGDPTGLGDFTAINNAISAAGPTGVMITLGRGDWYLKPGNLQITVAKPVWFSAHGATIHVVNGAAGDLIRWFDSTNPVGRNYFGGGWIGGIIDGASASAGVTAMHVGDIEAFVIRDLTIQNVSGGSLRLDNSLWWTEEADIRLVVVNCPGPTFEATAGFPSFGYGNFDYTVISNVGLNGVQVLNGAFLYHGSLRMRGNFFGDVNPVSNFAFGMSGVGPAGNSAGRTSLMQSMRFEMQLECATAAFTPKAIVMDAVNFAFANELEGIIDLANGSGTFAPSTIATGQFGFTGMMNANGDTALSPVQGYWSSTAAPVIYRSVVNFFQAVFPTPLADMFRATLAGNWTVALTAAGINGNQCLPYPQVVTIEVQQSAGGGNTLTWPHPGAPTLANPIVRWPGGVAPVMTAAANAVDVYTLKTLDGIHWDGTASQNVS